MSITEITNELSPEELAAEKQRRRKKAVRKKVFRVIDRIFGFFLATGIMFGIAGLSLEYVLIKGPSPALQETFVMTMLETRRFKFIPNIFMTEAEMAEMIGKKESDQRVDAAFDASLINIPSQEPGEGSDAEEGSASAPQYPEDEDGDGIIFEEIKGSGFVGYMITILDPMRVFVGMPDTYGGSGRSLEEYCQKYGAIGGINGGGFVDMGGGGNGGMPDGLTIIDGVCYNEGYGGDPFAGFDDKGILHVGFYSYFDVLEDNIVNGVSFGPILIMNGEAMNPVSSVNPRTAIGQRADGAVLMLVIDGRQAHSAGATYQDLIDIMLDHGAVNACNMDGGSSTSMWYNGEYVNSCSSQAGFSRSLPNAFLFK